MFNESLAIAIGVVLGILGGIPLGVLIVAAMQPHTRQDSEPPLSPRELDVIRARVAMSRCQLLGMSVQEIRDAAGIGYGYPPDVAQIASRLEVAAADANR